MLFMGLKGMLHVLRKWNCVYVLLLECVYCFEQTLFSTLNSLFDRSGMSYCWMVEKKACSHLPSII